MLFTWSVNKNIDVVIVWDVNCGIYQLTTTDPDGDGILGTKMVDGPFIGFSAAFDLNTQEGQPPIAEGGYEVSVPVYKNPSDLADASPLLLDHTVFSASDLPDDQNAKESCVGNCYGFETNGVIDGDGYQYVLVVLPITEQTPYYSIYKTYDPDTTSWSAFVINDRNNVQSAPLTENGLCPQPGDGSYDRSENGSLKDKLRGGDQCIELEIEDNGPNDHNPAVGIVSDPGGVAAVEPKKLPDPSTSNGGCTMAGIPQHASKQADWWLVGGFLALVWFFSMRRKHKLSC